MNNLKNIEIIKEALLLHLEDTPVVRAILFGSYAKNTANSMSDIDLVIDSRGRLKGLKFFGLLDKLTNSLGKNIDLIEMCEIEENSSIFNVITEEGVIVYDRTH